MFRKRRIYLDYASITPIDERVLKVMQKAAKLFANPSSLYKEGVEAKKALQNARKEIAKLLHALSNEIFFTSGGTEGNNMAILGAYIKAREIFKKPHMIVSSIEHSSVLECAKHLQTRGVEVTFIEPNEEGIIDPKKIRDALRPETFLVSVHLANNEIGTIEPIAEISKSIRHFKKNFSNPQSPISNPFPLLHCDACQAFSYVEINTLTLHVDLLTLDGSKVYGPRGIGVLYKKRGIEIGNLMHGGGQEMGLRGGTENLPAILGLAEALKISDKERVKESARLRKLQDYFLAKLQKEVPGALVNGSISERLPNNINFCIPGLDAEFAVLQFDAAGIAISSASSCLSKNEVSASYVVKAIRPEESCESSSLRISFGRSTKKQDIDLFFATYSKIRRNHI